MKAIYTGICALLLVGLVGCSGSGTPGGNTSGKDKASTPLVGNADETFTLDPPNLATTLKQGEAKQITIGINRGKNFSEDVALHFDNVPKGVTFDPASPAIKASEKEAKVTVKADDKAAIGDFTIKVTGKPAKGTEAAHDLKVTVKEK